MKIYTVICCLFFSVSSLFIGVSSAQEATIIIINETVRPGHLIKVKVNSTEKLNTRAWVGIFQGGTDSEYLTYQYVDGETVTLTAPEKPGDYELRLYSDDPGTLLITKNFKINRILPDEYEITLVTKKVNPSSQFDVYVKTSFKMDSMAWVGVFKGGFDEEYSQYESYKYIGNPTEKTVRLNAPSEPGDYEIRFYSADPGQLIHRIPFRVGKPDLPGISFTLDKKAYAAEEDITISYVGHVELAESAWIGLFKAGLEENSYRGYLDYIYLKPKSKGVLSFQAPAIKGKYEARMFYAETGPMLLSPVNFEVTSSIDQNSLKNELNSKGKVTLYGIYFDLNKSIVKSESFVLIEQIAKMLLANPSTSIQVGGHTDAEGDNNYNQELSERRARAVKEILIQKYNVTESQLKSKGFGETQPIGSNETASGRAKNRRVELKKL